MAEEKPDEPKESTASKAPPPKKPAPKESADIEERMEGVQGWMAEIEKKQERSTRVGGVAVVLALLAAAGALVLGIMNKQDAATTDDVDELTEKVNALGASVAQQTEKQVQGLNQRLVTLEQQISSLTERQRKAENDIAAVQKSQSAAAAAAAADTSAQADSGTDTANPKPDENP